MDENKSPAAATSELSAGLGAPLKIVAVHLPALTVRGGSELIDGMEWPDGSLEIMLDDFVFVRVNYDHRYTDNAHRRWLADEIVKLIAPNASLQPAERSEDRLEGVVGRQPNEDEA